MKNATESIIKIHVKNSEHAAKLCEVLESIKLKASYGGDIRIEGKTIGHDVNIKQVRVKLKENKNIIKIYMKHVDHAHKIYKTMLEVRDTKSNIGDFIFNGKNIGYNVKIGEISHKINGEEERSS